MHVSCLTLNLFVWPACMGPLVHIVFVFSRKNKARAKLNNGFGDTPVVVLDGSFPFSICLVSREVVAVKIFLFYFREKVRLHCITNETRVPHIIYYKHAEASRSAASAGKQLKHKDRLEIGAQSATTKTKNNFFFIGPVHNKKLRSKVKERQTSPLAEPGDSGCLLNIRPASGG